MNSREIIAFNLKRLMEANKNLDTQDKLHVKTGMSQSSIGRILKAEVSVGVDKLDDLAKAFKCGVSEFFLNPGEKVQPTQEGEQESPSFDLDSTSTEELASFIKDALDVLVENSK